MTVSLHLSDNFEIQDIISEQENEGDTLFCESFSFVTNVQAYGYGQTVAARKSLWDYTNKFRFDLSSHHSFHLIEGDFYRQA